MFDVDDDTKGGYRRIEVLTGPGRRRRWSEAEKAQIVAESLAPGACVSEVARRWQILPQQVFGWRRRVNCGAALAPAAHVPPAFVPIITEPAAQALPMSAGGASASAIEIRIAGAVVRAAPGTDADHLTTILRAVRASAR